MMDIYDTVGNAGAKVRKPTKERQPLESIDYVIPEEDFASVGAEVRKPNKKRQPLDSIDYVLPDDP